MVSKWLVLDPANGVTPYYGTYSCKGSMKEREMSRMSLLMCYLYKVLFLACLFGKPCFRAPLVNFHPCFAEGMYQIKRDPRWFKTASFLNADPVSIVSFSVIWKAILFRVHVSFCFLKSSFLSKNRSKICLVNFWIEIRIQKGKNPCGSETLTNSNNLITGCWITFVHLGCTTITNQN